MATHVEAVIVDALLREADNITLPVGFEKAMPNTDYNPRGNTAGYVSFAVLRNNTSNPRIRFGGEPIRRGILQASVFTPEGVGEIVGTEVAGTIRDAFARGTKITSGNTTIRIDEEPSVGSAIQQKAWQQLPVSIPYVVYP